MSKAFDRSSGRAFVMSPNRARIRLSGVRFQVLVASLTFQRMGFMPYPPGNLIPVGSVVDLVRFRQADFAWRKNGGGPSITRRVNFGDGTSLPIVTTVHNDGFNEVDSVNNLGSVGSYTANEFTLVDAFSNNGLANPQTGFYTVTVTVSDPQPFSEMLTSAMASLNSIYYPPSFEAFMQDSGFGLEVVRKDSITNHFTEIDGDPPVFVSTTDINRARSVGSLMIYYPDKCFISAGFAVSLTAPRYIQILPGSLARFTLPSFQIKAAKISHNAGPGFLSVGVMNRELLCGPVAAQEILPTQPIWSEMKRVNSDQLNTGGLFGTSYNFAAGIEGNQSNPVFTYPLPPFNDYFNQSSGAVKPWVPSCYPTIVSEPGFVEPGLP